MILLSDENSPHSFAQGLQVPEVVPFRLTRDMVDGMGPLGTEGTFTATAEHTLSVLRENAQGLQTIVSAVVADPLYRWQHVQKEIDYDIANSVMTKIQAKLQGYEDSNPEQQTVSSQVQYVVNEATSFDNLSRMFHGWGSWV